MADRCAGRADEVEVFYGPCRAGGESGCGNDVSVRSQPACLRPRELAALFGAGTVTTLRGVPAVAGEGQVALLTRDTLITVAADDPRSAVDALAPVAGAAGAALPRPDAVVTGGQLRNRQCPA